MTIPLFKLATLRSLFEIKSTILDYNLTINVMKTRVYWNLGRYKNLINSHLLNNFVVLSIIISIILYTTSHISPNHWDYNCLTPYDVMSWLKVKVTSVKGDMLRWVIISMTTEDNDESSNLLSIQVIFMIQEEG